MKYSKNHKYKNVFMFMELFNYSFFFIRLLRERTAIKEHVQYIINVLIVQSILRGANNKLTYCIQCFLLPNTVLVLC